MPNGKYKFIYGYTKAEIDMQEKKINSDLDNGMIVGDSTLVGEWAKQWFETYKSSLREHTIQGYKNAYNNHIMQYIGTIPLKEVRPIHIQQVMNAASRFSEDLQRKILNTMNQLFNTAITNRLLAVNPCTGIKITKHSLPEKEKFLTIDQQNTLMLSIQNLRAKAFCGLCLYCGLRREKALGLMWSDIDFEKKCLTVNRAVTFLKNQQDDNHELKSKAAHRTIPIPQPLIEILNITPKLGLYIITGAKGQEMTLIAFRHLWKYVTDVVDFPVHPHMLRHSYASALHSAGIDLKEAQVLLGHNDIRMTANIYTHIQKNECSNSENKINMYFKKLSESCQISKKG